MHTMSLLRTNAMADQEQLALLKQGAQIWNQWRREHPDIEVDLSEADFHTADLSYADLRIVLSHCDLT